MADKKGLITSNKIADEFEEQKDVLFFLNLMESIKMLFTGEEGRPQRDILRVPPGDPRTEEEIGLAERAMRGETARQGEVQRLLENIPELGPSSAQSISTTPTSKPTDVIKQVIREFKDYSKAHSAHNQKLIQQDKEWRKGRETYEDRKKRILQQNAERRLRK